MSGKPPAKIEDMKTLFYSDVKKYKDQLAGYMPSVPDYLVIVQQAEDSSYCILGTDNNFDNWDLYSNYVFPKLETALEFPEVIFRIADFPWKKV